MTALNAHVMVRLEEALAATRRRLLIRSLLASELKAIPFGLAAGFVPLFVAKWTPPSISPEGLLSWSLGISIIIGLLMTWIRRPDSRDAARALDRAGGLPELFLTAADPHRPLESSRLKPSFETGLEKALEMMSPARAVPLLTGGRTFRIAVVLAALDSALALTPDATRSPSRRVTQLHEWIAAAQEHVPTDDARTVLDRIASHSTPDQIRRTADEAWNKFVGHPNRTIPPGSEEFVRSLSQGRLEKARRAWKDQGSSIVDDAKDRTQVADALRNMATLDGPNDWSALLRNVADEIEAGNGAGVSNSLANAHPPAAQNDSSLESAVMEDILLSVYAQLGTAPPGMHVPAGLPDDDPRQAGTSPPSLRQWRPERFSARYRRLIEAYMTRRQAKRLRDKQR